MGNENVITRIKSQQKRNINGLVAMHTLYITALLQLLIPCILILEIIVVKIFVYFHIYTSWCGTLKNNFVILSVKYEHTLRFASVW